MFAGQRWVLNLESEQEREGLERGRSHAPQPQPRAHLQPHPKPLNPMARVIWGARCHIGSKGDSVKSVQRLSTRCEQERGGLERGLPHAPQPQPRVHLQPHDGARPFHQKSTCLCANDCRTLCGIKLVTQHPGIRLQRNPRSPPCGWPAARCPAEGAHLQPGDSSYYNIESYES